MAEYRYSAGTPARVRTEQEQAAAAIEMQRRRAEMLRFMFNRYRTEPPGGRLEPPPPGYGPPSLPPPRYEGPM